MFAWVRSMTTGLPLVTAISAAAMAPPWQGLRQTLGVVADRGALQRVAPPGVGS